MLDALALLPVPPCPAPEPINPPAADASRDRGRGRAKSGGFRCCIDGMSEAYWRTLSTVIKRVAGERRRRGCADGCLSRESVTWDYIGKHRRLDRMNSYNKGITRT